MSGPRRVGLDLDHFTMRVLTDCLNEATRAYWLRRAESFEAARPTPGDFHGGATRDELRRRWHELTEMANACRARAQIAPLDELAPELDDVWQEAS